MLRTRIHKNFGTKGNNSVNKGPNPLIFVHDTSSSCQVYAYQISASYLKYKGSYAPDTKLLEEEEE